MNTIPIYVNGVEQGVCELSRTRKYMYEKLSETHTLTPDEVQSLQSIWAIEYQPKDKIPVDIDRIDYTI